MFDPNRNFADGYVDVTPSDVTPFARPLKGVVCSADGTLKVTTVASPNSPAWTGTITVVAGHQGTAPISFIWSTGSDDIIDAGII